VIARFDAWFDSLPEPRRFLVFMAMVLGFLVPLNLAAFFQSPAQDVLLGAGVVWLVAVMILAARRAF
jgi:hypothetical protein